MVVGHDAAHQGINDEAADREAPETRKKKVKPTEFVDCGASNGRANYRKIEHAKQPRMGERHLQRRVEIKSITHFHRWLVDFVFRPNDPNSATALAARVERTVRSRTPATLERMAQRPSAAAHG